ncbi:hypothetical protein ABZZ79_23660 [Streptomyces sp. NPDC006458]|uniref:hypothetical protein n=1 Tax=Streptomyces sp. NPDC006458 TaxID=3154302 RepID=UPI0033B77212
MHSATYARVARRRLRGAAAAAGLTGVLVLSGCTDDGSGDDRSPGASVSATPSADGTPDGGRTSSPPGTLEGSWLTTSEGSAVALVVTGGEAALFGSKGAVCSGSASAGSIRLTCTVGGDDRALGTVDSVDDTTLKVTWEGRLGQETYQRAEGGKLPSGLPTAGLG